MSNTISNLHELETCLNEHGLDTRGISDVTNHTQGGMRQTVSIGMSPESNKQRFRRLLLRIEKPSENGAGLELDEEYELMEFLQSSEVPIPQPVFFEDDSSIIGSRFFATEYIGGNTYSAFCEEDAKWISDCKEDIKGDLLYELVDYLVKIHSYGYKQVDFLDPVHPYTLIDDKIAYWKDKIMEYDQLKQTEINNCIQWLEMNKPFINELTLIHGDYRIDNVIINNYEISSVLDWELSRVSDPMYDLGFSCVQYFSGYTSQFTDSSELAMGFIDKDRFLDEYERRSPDSIDYTRVRFWRIFITFLITMSSLSQECGIEQSGSRNTVQSVTGSPEILLAELSSILPPEYC